jgi:ketosteroid isomerase-like protein
VNASRRAVLGAAVAMMLAGTTTSTMLAQSPENAAVEQAGETLRNLMINPDRPALERIFADQLSYGHSDGRVQTKAEFIDALVNGKSVFKSISLSGQTVSLGGDIAIVRHRFEADAISNGVPAQPRIRVLQVWQKQSDGWRLLVRQAH